MNLVFGTKSFRPVNAHTDHIRMCPRCGFFGALTRQRWLRSMTLFFTLPILPLGSVGSVDTCLQRDLVPSVG